MDADQASKLEAQGALNHTPGKKRFMVRKTKQRPVEGKYAADGQALKSEGAFASPIPPRKKKVLVALRITPGQKVRIGHKSISMPPITSQLNHTASAQQIKTIPQAIAMRGSRAKLGGARRNSKNDVLAWSFLGKEEDLLARERKQRLTSGVLSADQSSAADRDAQADNASTSEHSLLSSHGRAMHREQKKLRKHIRGMQFEDRLIYTKDRRALKLWKQRNEQWRGDARKLARRFNKHPDDLVVNGGEDFRARMEEYALLEKSLSTTEKYGAYQWQMSLRDQYEMAIPVGNEFSGLFCTVSCRPKNNFGVVIKTKGASQIASRELGHTGGFGDDAGGMLVDDRGRLFAPRRTKSKPWSEDPRLVAKHKRQFAAIRDLLPVAERNATLQSNSSTRNNTRRGSQPSKATYSVNNARDLTDLAVVGRDLFDVDDGDLFGAESSGVHDAEGLFLDESKQIMSFALDEDEGGEEEDLGDYPLAAGLYEQEGGLGEGDAGASGARVSISKHRISFETNVDSTVTSSFEFRNTGSTTLYYEWRQKQPTPRKDPALAVIEAIQAFLEEVDAVFRMLDGDGSESVPVQLLLTRINNFARLEPFLGDADSQRPGVAEIRGVVGALEQRAAGESADASSMSGDAKSAGPAQEQEVLGGEQPAPAPITREQFRALFSQLPSAGAAISRAADAEAAAHPSSSGADAALFAFIREANRYFDILDLHGDGYVYQNELVYYLQHSHTCRALASQAKLHSAENSSSMLDVVQEFAADSDDTRVHKDDFKYFLGLDLTWDEAVQAEVALAPQGLTSDNAFFFLNCKGVLLPDATGKVNITFHPARAGVFLDVLELFTTPELSAASATRETVYLRGFGVARDHNTVHRAFVESRLAADIQATQASNHVRDQTAHAKPDEPDTSEYRRLFYVRNREEKLYFYADLFAEFQQLAEDTLQCHKRILRQTRAWDYSCATLKQWIATIPERNIHLQAGLMIRWKRLVVRSAVRPEPDAEYYAVMSSLLVDALQHVPRLNRQIRQELDIVEPLVDVKAAEAERARREAEEAKKGKRGGFGFRPSAARHLSEEDKRAKAAADEQQAKADAAYYAEFETKVADRKVLEAQCHETLSGFVSELFTNIALQFGHYTHAPATQEQALTTLAGQARTRSQPYRLAMWGNHLHVPDLGAKRETEKQRKEREEAERRNRFGARGKNQASAGAADTKKASPFEDINVSFVAGGVTSAFAVTRAKEVYSWPMVHVDKKAQKKTGNANKGKKPVPAKGKGKEKKKGEEELAEEGAEDVTAMPSPVAIPELQGFNFRKLACGPEFTVCLTEDGDMFYHPLDSFAWLEEVVAKEAAAEKKSSRSKRDKNAEAEQAALEAEQAALEVAPPTDEELMAVVLETTPGARLGRVGSAIFAKNMVDVAAGQEHKFLVACDALGRLFTWGENNKNSLLGHNDKRNRSIPDCIPLKANIVGVAAGASHMVCFSDAGEAWSWGHGDFGVLGLGDKKGRAAPTRISPFCPPSQRPSSSMNSDKKSSSKDKRLSRTMSRDLHAEALLAVDADAAPVDPTAFPRVVAVECGLFHTVVLCETDEVYTWGRGTHGALGFGDTKDCDTPRLVAELTGRGVSQVAAGSSHCLALVGDSGDVFAWGHGSTGALGSGVEQSDALTPVCVASFSEKESEDRALWAELYQGAEPDEPLDGYQPRTRHIFAGGLHSFALRKRFPVVEEE